MINQLREILQAKHEEYRGKLNMLCDTTHWRTYAQQLWWCIGMIDEGMPYCDLWIRVDSAMKQAREDGREHDTKILCWVLEQMNELVT